MRQIIAVLAAALIAAALAVAGTVVFTDRGPERDAARVAETRTSAPPEPSAPDDRSGAAEPRPTVTVTEPGPAVPEQPDLGAADADFVALIAAHGIVAPDGWAVEAGRATCGQDYASAREYLTDGGLYEYHVQTFLDDWMITHGGC